MPDGLVPTQAHVQVHSLLHTNLNTVDVSAAARFYADVLGLVPGMKTARTAADGRALGVAGAPVTECWFLYDHRGPRTAPAVEVLEWETPATVGVHPAEPHHIGISSLGYAVPSIDLLRARQPATAARGRSSPPGRCAAARWSRPGRPISTGSRSS